MVAINVHILALQVQKAIPGSHYYQIFLIFHFECNLFFFLKKVQQRLVLSLLSVIICTSVKCYISIAPLILYIHIRGIVE